MFAAALFSIGYAAEENSNKNNQGLETYKLIDSFRSETALNACPMPGLAEKINTACEECKADPENGVKESKFVELLKLSMKKYDCRRDYNDLEPVPAWWLAEGKDAWNWFKLLSALKSKSAVSFFKSKEFKSTLSKEYAEWYYGLNKSGKKGK